MFTPHIKSSTQTFVPKDEGLKSLPNLDYEKLLVHLGMEPEVLDAIEDGTLDPVEPTLESPTTVPNTDKTVESVVVKDLRTSQANYSIEDVSFDTNLDELDKHSIIPIPGLMINEESDDADMAPIVSDWIAPHGPFWNNYYGG